MARERDDRDEDEDDRPRRRPRDDEYEDRGPPQTTNPGSTKAAGIIWAIMGSLVLLMVLANFGVAASNNAMGGPLLCGLALPTLVGAVFLMVGIQTMNGSAKGTLANGIGSIIFAALLGGFGALTLLGGAFFAAAAKAGGAAPPDAGLLATVAMIAAVIYLITGVMLLVAGILAIKGKTDYLRWRKYLKQQSGGGRSRRRERDDEEEEERPRRKRPRDDDEE